MATSGTRAFALDVVDIMEEAFERVGREMRTAYEARKGRRAINLLFQDWSNRNINLWTLRQETTSLVAGQREYTMEDYDIDVVEAVVTVDGTDFRIERITREDYLYIPNKDTQSRPTQIYVERTIPAVIKLWPTPLGTETITTYRIQRIQDAKTSQNDVDVPSRFMPALVSGLAYYLSISMAPEKTQLMKQVYDDELGRAMDEDSERGSWHIRPMMR